MGLSRRCFSVAANSLLESVISLTIISICLFIGIRVYAAVFSPKTSIKALSDAGKANEVFFQLQLGQDSILQSSEWKIEVQENGAINEIKVQEAGQGGKYKSYYIAND
jgi:hypothetical protein